MNFNIGPIHVSIDLNSQKYCETALRRYIDVNDKHHTKISRIKALRVAPKRIVDAAHKLTRYITITYSEIRPNEIGLLHAKELVEHLYSEEK